MYFKEFSDLREEVRKFENNINKDSQERRQNLQILSRKLVEVNALGIRLGDLRVQFNESPEALIKNKVDEIKLCVVEITDRIQNSKRVLLDRLTSLENKNNSEIMSEKFDLRTATSLLPNMDNSENTTKQLIDAIELYAQLLDEGGKTLLVNYVLKVKLSQRAKLRLGKSYASVEALLIDMKEHLLTKKSASALASQLHNAKQYHKSIDDFGKTIEELMVDLTLAQADNDENAIKALSKINEKLAVNAFAKGLKNHELRTIIKARNFDKLNEAVCAAVEEGREIGEASPRTDSQVFHMRGKKQFRNCFKGDNKSKFSSAYGRGNSYPHKHYKQQKNNNYQQNLYRGQWQSRQSNQVSRNHGKPTGKAYVTNCEQTNTKSADTEFFRRC